MWHYIPSNKKYVVYEVIANFVLNQHIFLFYCVVTK